MAHKKSGGSTKNGRDSNPQYRGVKLFSGEYASAGSIIVRQCGTRFKPGHLVGCGRDHTLYAKADGTVRYRSRFVDVLPSDPRLPAFAAVERTSGR